jgi:hypothetical protein
MTPLASGISATLVSSQKFRVPPLYLVVLGSCLQLIGVGLYSTISTNVEDGIQKVQYVYEVFMGWGFGLVLSSLLTFIPLVVDKKDTPVVSLIFLSCYFLLPSSTRYLHLEMQLKDNIPTPPIVQYKAVLS